MRYADEATVLDQLSLSTDLSDDDDAIDRVRALEEGLCLTFDEKTGVSFGSTPVAETRTVVMGSATGCRTAYWSPRLVLSTPLRSVTAIVEGGDWNGTAWVNGDTLAAADYILTNRTRDGYYGIDRINGSWSGSVRITGIWADQPMVAVPADVREAMTFVVSETYRMQHASPADELGPDGMAVRPRNPWRYEQVVEAINRHRIVKVLL